MKNPPRILGASHSTILAVIGLYLVLACAPTSQYKDPTSAPETSLSSINGEIEKAVDDGGNIEDGYHEGDTGLITQYYQIYSQSKEVSHMTVSVIYKDTCQMAIKVDSVESDGTSQSQTKTYVFDYKPECQSSSPVPSPSPGKSDAANASVATASFQSLSTAGATSLLALSNSKFSLNDTSQNIPKKYYGLTVVHYNKTIPNCSQYPGCVAPFTRLEYDEIQYPDDDARRDRHHHVLELSSRLPAIVRFYSHCDSHIVVDSSDNRKLPVTECATVTDFLGGQVIPPSPTPPPN